MATELLPVGGTVAMTLNQVYACPARAHIIHSKAAVEVSDEVGGTFTALTNANTVGAPNAAAFVKSTGAGNFITCKPY